MSYVRPIPATEATGDLQGTYDGIMKASGGKLPPRYQVMGHSPRALQKFLELLDTVSFGGSSLGRRREELIATLIFTIGGCVN
jgi:hypothetical protein